MQRWVVRPRLEVLEERTLLSTASVEPLLPVRFVGGPLDAGVQTPAALGSTGESANPADAIPVPGLAGLLADLRLLAPPAPTETPAGDDTGAIAPAMPLPALPQFVRSVATSIPGPDVVHALNPGFAIAPPARPSPAPAMHTPTNQVADAISGVAQSATPLPGGTPSIEAQAVATSLWGVKVSSTASLADTAAPPTALAGHEAVVPAAAEAVWFDPAVGTIQVQPPETTAAPVWALADVESTAATAAAPEDVPEAVALQVGAGGMPAALADGVLLERFVAQHDQAAFAALVARHERLVFNVCQRVLGDAQAAEDALQATFLVLARKAGALDLHRPLSGWLYLVAYHLALRLRAVAARRRRCETRAAGSRSAEQASESAAAVEDEEIHNVLHEELQRLPEKYRVPLVLCYLKGQTHAEAARTIGMPRGSIAKRIGEGLQHLRERLTDRGISL